MGTPASACRWAYVGVPVGVGHDLGGIEHGAAGGAQRAEAGDPVAVPSFQHVQAYGPVPAGIAQRGWQQHQSGAGGGGEPGGDALLLGDDHLRGVLADRQPPCPAAGLGVVVEEDRGAAGVAGQAVQRQAGDVLGAAAGVDRDLHGGADLGRLELVQAGAQRGHDLRGQVTSRLAALGQGRDVGSGEDDVAGQVGGGLAWPGQPQGADPGQDRARARAGLVALVAADRALRFQVAEAVQEVLGVPAAQRGGHGAVVGPGTQAF